jgi:tight adherence protein C
VALDCLVLLATLLLSLANGLVAYALGKLPAPARPLLGTRGRQRSSALALHASFRAVEPALRWLAGLASRLPLMRTRVWLAQRLTEAGDPLGLDADECLALSCLGAGIEALIAGSCTQVIDARAVWVLPAIACGAALPVQRVHSLSSVRKRRIARELPAAIDLLALCMSAGLDFTGALRSLVQQSGAARSPLAFEFARVREELSLGRTRSEALSALATRVPIAPLRDFTSAVIQAELKGNPLQDAIAIQARMMRLQRSVLAEEAAARASVLLAFPLILLLGAILLLILGPFLIHGVEF